MSLPDNPDLDIPLRFFDRLDVRYVYVASA